MKYVSDIPLSPTTANWELTSEIVRSKDTENSMTLAVVSQHQNYGTLQLLMRWYSVDIAVLSPAVSNFRTRCSVIRDYPLHRIDIRNNLEKMFSEGSPCHVRRCNVYHLMSIHHSL